MLFVGVCLLPTFLQRAFFWNGEISVTLQHSLQDEPTMENQMITLATYHTAFEAELARQHLENWGIVSFVNDQHTSSVLPPLTPSIGYVKLRCRESDAAKAFDLLMNPSANPELTEKDTVTIEERFQNTMGDDYVPVHTYCPKCESTEIYRKNLVLI